MKITIVADVFGEENNGTTATIKRMIEGLVHKGHEIRVVSPFKDDKSTNPRYYSVDRRCFGIFDDYVRRNGVELAKPDDNVLRRAIEGADVVHLVLPFKLSKHALKICKELNIACTSAFHCQPENVSSHIGMKNSYLVNKALYRYFHSKFYKNVKYIHCPSEFIKSELEKNHYTAKKFAISNGVIPTYHKMHCEKPEDLKDKFVILFIGRMSREKRHDVLINAAKESKYSDKIQLIFAGKGPLESKIKKQARGLKNPPIMGYFPKEELVKIVNFTDLYVHPSDIEIEAIACLENITCGVVPIISNSKKSATRFFALDDRSLFRRADVLDLADKIDYFIEHEEEKKQLSEKYEEYAKQFNIENSLNKMIDMFALAIEEKAAEVV